ncbi:bZIP transcription factor 29-like [Zingiber officinale]|uniref:bZIP transcription factor 29-like n=1 Tax=Zingiber officinale TaxID=94328 RepID=UPI001C4A9F8E|nr:bZIP transcription factor 29-like [Zingiber officinale]
MDHHDAPDVGTDGSDLPPLRAHRQSRSEVPFAFLPPLPLSPSDGAGVKMESHDGVAGYDLFDAFMDLDGFDMLNSSEDNHRRDSGSRMNGTENEAESNTSLGAAKQGGADRPGLVTVASRHCRSLSMDSFTGRFHFEEEPSKLQRPCRRMIFRDSTGLINKNNELKFRLQAMEQQAQLRDAFNVALTIEVQRLELASSGFVDAHDLSGSNHQPPFNAQAMDFREEQ